MIHWISFYSGKKGIELLAKVHDFPQEAVIKTKKCKKGRMVIWGGLTNSWEKRSERKRKDIPIWMQCSKE